MMTNKEQKTILDNKKKVESAINAYMRKHKKFVVNASDVDVYDSWLHDTNTECLTGVLESVAYSAIEYFQVSNS